MHIVYKLEITQRRPSGSRVLRAYDMSTVPPLYSIGTSMIIDGAILKVVSCNILVEEVVNDSVDTIVHQIVVE